MVWLEQKDMSLERDDTQWVGKGNRKDHGLQGND